MVCCSFPQTFKVDTRHVKNNVKWFGGVPCKNFKFQSICITIKIQWHEEPYILVDRRRGIYCFLPLSIKHHKKMQSENSQLIEAPNIDDSSQFIKPCKVQNNDDEFSLLKFVGRHKQHNNNIFQNVRPSEYCKSDWENASQQ